MPSTNGSNLYRITTFDRVVEMLERNELYFSHPSAWDDPYETQIKHKDSKSLYGLCLCRRAVSDAMWRIYSPHKIGVQIHTTRQALVKALDDAAKAQSVQCRLDDVEYVTTTQLEDRTSTICGDLAHNHTFENATASLFLKRTPFEHEHEVRAVVLVPNTHSREPPASFRLKVDARQIIQSIVVDPRAPDAYFKAYQHYFSCVLGFPGFVMQSTLYGPIDSHAVGIDVSVPL